MYGQIPYQTTICTVIFRFIEKNSSIPKAFGMPRGSIYSPLKFRGDVIRQLPDDKGVNKENLIFSFWAEIKLV